MNWNQKTIKKTMAKRAKALGIRMPQAQNLLAQERFIARLAKTEFGIKFIWKGRSLILRAYSTLEIPRYTVDLDFLVKGISISDVKNVFNETAKVTREFCTAIGVTPIKFHDLRATFITNLLSRGESLARVMAIVGHSQLKTTNGYLRKAGVEIIGGTDKLGYGIPKETLGKVVYLQPRATE